MSIIIGIHGQFSSGKDTIAKYLVKNHNFCRIAFADKLKDILMNYDNESRIKRERWNMDIARDLFQSTDEDLIKKIDDLMQSAQPGTWKKVPYEELYGTKSTFSRTMLQVVGDGMRNIVPGKDNIWIEYALNNRKEDNIVISDVRYFNEAEAIKQKGGILWKVDKPNSDAFGKEHNSEVELRDYKFDIYIPNNRSLFYLYQLVELALGLQNGFFGRISNS